LQSGAPFSILAGMRQRKPTIVIDTREQRPLEFTLPTSVSKLDFGDYSIAGLESRVAVERKSLDDLFGSFTRTRVRMDERLQELGELAAAAIVVEATALDVARGSKRTAVNGHSLLGSISTRCAQLGVAFVLAGDRYGSAAFIEAFLLAFHRQARSQKRASLRNDSAFGDRKSRVYSGG